MDVDRGPASRTAARFQRHPDPESTPRTAPLELFYDLVFVFAVTQISHALLVDLTWAGAYRSALLLFAVWWSWNYTTWVTNELDPVVPAVRALVIAVMLGSLVMAVAVPGAFEDRGLLFAGAYVTIQVGRHCFLAFGSARPATRERARAVHVLAWFAFAAVPWLLGGVLDGPARVALWSLAVVVDLGGPLTTYRLPRIGPVGMSAWLVQTSHFAERFQLFVIIALGESVVITGATATELSLGGTRVVALVIAFLGAAAQWWLYFDQAADVAERQLEHATGERTRTARDAYTLLHVVLIAGIIVSAVGDELVIAHPDDRLSTPELVAVCGGPAIYLLGLVAFGWRMTGAVPLVRLRAAAICGGALSAALVLPYDEPALVIAALLLTVLVGVPVAERLRSRAGRQVDVQTSSRW